MVVRAGIRHDDGILAGRRTGAAVEGGNGRRRGVQRQGVLGRTGRCAAVGDAVALVAAGGDIAGIRARRRAGAGCRRRNGGRGRGHGDGRIGGHIAAAREERGDQKHRQNDEPYAGCAGNRPADGRLKAPPAPEQIDAQRGQKHQQQEGHPVVFIHIAHQRALVRIGFVRVTVGVLVHIAVVVAFGLAVVSVVVIAVPVGIFAVAVVAVVIALFLYIAIVIRVAIIVRIAVEVVVIGEFARVGIIVLKVAPCAALGETAGIAVGREVLFRSIRLVLVALAI